MKDIKPIPIREVSGVLLEHLAEYEKKMQELCICPQSTNYISTTADALTQKYKTVKP